MSIYEDLLGKWIHPLPSKAPSRLRVWEEKSLQQIAMHLFLASHGVHLTSEDALHTSHGQPHQYQNMSSSNTNSPLQIGHTLAKYCSFSGPKALPKSLQKLADSWETGVDPSTFHWREDEEDSPEEGRQKKGKNRDQSIGARLGEAAGPSQSGPSNVLETQLSQDIDSQGAQQLFPPSVLGAPQATMQSHKRTKKPKKRPEGFR